MGGIQIMHGVRPSGHYVKGDAPIASSQSDHAPTQMSDALLVGGANETGGGGKTKVKKEQGKKQLTKKGKGANKPSATPWSQREKTVQHCLNFNRGACQPSTAANGSCPVRPELCHFCSICGKQGHPASECFQGKGVAKGGQRRKGNGKGGDGR